MAVKIELKNITKKFGDYVAVNNINACIDPAELVSLLGPSGCGKTTLLRMIAGLEIPTSGKIYFDGEEVEKIKVHKRNTAMVFQNYAIFPHKTVKENIMYGLRMRKMPKDEIEERVAKAVEIVSIQGLEKRYPSQLSGGQQQRVALARAIVYDPDVLLLDEPLSALDKKLRDQMRFELRRIQQQVGITTVFVTHDQEEAMGLSDRIIIMDKAMVVQEGTPLDVYKNPKNAYVANFLGSSNFLQGTIRNHDGKTWMLLADETEIMVPFNEQNGAEVEIAIRPQSISFRRNEDTDNVLQVQYVASSYLGINTRYLLRYQGKDLMAETLNLNIADTNFQAEDNATIPVYFAPYNIIRLK